MNKKVPSSQFSRRDFIKVAGAASVTAAVAGTQQDLHAAESAGDGYEYDAIVIGGGFAGVTAARNLMESGVKTLMLEARDRLGGRTFTSSFAGHKTELGGTWVGWAQPHVWAEISRYGLELEETPGAVPDRIAWWSQGKVTHDDAQGPWAMLDEGLQKVSRTPNECFPEPFRPLATEEWKKYDGMNLKERLTEVRLPQGQADIVDALLSANCHNQLQAGGLVDMLRWNALGGWDTTRLFDNLSRYTFKHGTKSLIDAMMKDGKPDLRLSTPVARVEQQGDKVRVITKGNDVFVARAAVVTVPMNVLKDVEFSPPLSKAKLAASRQGHSGSGHKTFMHVAQEIDPYFLAMAPTPHPFSLLFGYHGSPGEITLCAFGPPGSIDTADQAALQQRVREFLPNVEVTATLSYDWASDPYSQGTWCWYRPNQMTRYFPALQEREGRLFFASADSANGWRGFIDGAIERGLRSAQEIAELLS